MARMTRITDKDAPGAGWRAAGRGGRAGWLVVLALAACRRGPQPAAAELPAAICVAANHGEVVAVSGFLVAPEISFDCKDECFLEIAAAPDTHDGVYARFSAGNATGEIQPVAGHGDLFGAGARPLRPSELHVHGAAGQLLGVGDLVRATGQLAVRHVAGKLDCRMEVTAIEANDGTARPAAPRAAPGPVVFVDFDPIMGSRANRIAAGKAARAALHQAGIAWRMVDTETDAFYFDDAILRGAFDDAPPVWWPDALRATWTGEVATCKAAGGARSCARAVHERLWDRWLIDQRAARYVWAAALHDDGAGAPARVFGETFVPGEPTKRTLWVRASSDATLEAQAGALVRQLAQGEGKVEPRFLGAADEASSVPEGDQRLKVGAP